MRYFSFLFRGFEVGWTQLVSTVSVFLNRFRNCNWKLVNWEIEKQMRGVTENMGRGQALAICARDGRGFLNRANSKLLSSNYIQCSPRNSFLGNDFLSFMPVAMSFC